MSKYQSHRRDTGLVDAVRLFEASAPPTTSLWAWWNAVYAYTDAGKTTLCSSSGSDTCYTLADLSGNSRDLVQATAGNRPVWYSNELNGLPALNFDGTDDYMAIASGFTGARTHYFVLKNRSYNGGSEDLYTRHHDGVGTTQSRVRQGSSTPTIRINDLAAGINGTGEADGVYQMIQAVHDGASSFIKSNDLTTATGTLTNLSANTEIDLGGSGAGNSDCAPFNCCEYLIYSAAHVADSGDGLIVRQYLNSKYNLGLSQ